MELELDSSTVSGTVNQDSLGRFASKDLKCRVITSQEASTEFSKTLMLAIRYT